jgi:integrase
MALSSPTRLKRLSCSGASEFVGNRLTPEQVAAVADWIATDRHNEVYSLALLFAAFTGLRAGELAGTEIADLRLADEPDTDGTVAVTRTKRRVAGGFETGPTKSRKSRVVPVGAWLANRLRSYLTDVHPYGNPKSFAYKPTAPLFPGRLNNAAACQAGRNVKTPRTSSIGMNLSTAPTLTSGTYSPQRRL